MFMFQSIQNLHRTENTSQKRCENLENSELLRSIARTKLELEIANQNFSYATDPLLVDVYSYQIKAAQAKYSYLLQKARIKGLTQSKYVKRAFDDRTEQGG